MLELYDSGGTLIWDNSGIPLNKGEHAHVTVAEGTYQASGSERFAVLTGDPITRTVVGYYAVDQNGSGASTEFYTWVPSSVYDGEKFIVFAFADDTDVEISYTDTGVVIWTGTLHHGEHHEVTGLSSSYLHVTSTQPVSALTYFDQGYFVPAVSGPFSGTEFYTYVGTVGGWTQDLSVIAYEDGTAVEISDTDTGTPIWTGVLDEGQAHVESFNVEKYITVTSSGVVTVSVQPWVSWTCCYHQGAYVQSRTGQGIGVDLIGSTIDGGYLHVLAYQDNTAVSVYNSQTSVWIADYVLNAGDSVDANPGNGLWRIISDKPVSAYSGWGQWNAEFATLEFVVAQEVPVDIKPTSCRNPLNVGSKGVLPVAILGTEDIDMTQIDPASVRLEGVAPLRWALEDVATPFEPYTGKEDAFDCTTEGPDGFLDLTFKFDTQEIVADLGDVEDGDVLVLQLTGNLMEEYDGTAIVGEDVVVILKKGKK